MALVTMKEMLEDARRRKYAVAAFDVGNYEMIKSVVETAEELNAPVIISALKPDIIGKNLDYYAAMTKVAAAITKTPVCLHLDHAEDFNDIKRVIDYGFSSVMYDGSKLSFEENAKNTKQVSDYAKKFGITVEAELGHVTDAIAGSRESSLSHDAVVDDVHDFLTDSKEVKRFIEITNVDALAIAIGTAHGVYISKPELDFDRLAEINDISVIPLVLHGGSGTPNDAVKKSIRLGICKINIYSEILSAFNTELRNTLNRLENMSSWPGVVYKKPMEALKDKVREKIMLFGSDGKA